MINTYLTIHENDNLTVALKDLAAGDLVKVNGDAFALREDIRQKHKFCNRHIPSGGTLTMYGVTVGRATSDIPKGALVHQGNASHEAGDYQLTPGTQSWSPPDTSRVETLTWEGFHRADGSVGTRNYWLVIPLVFCENRNVDVVRESLVHQLGYLSERDFRIDTNTLVEKYRNGASAEEILEADVLQTHDTETATRVFPNVDGIKFLNHQGGCGGVPGDIQSLVNLLAGYIAHPNVGGATVLSLGCQMAQIDMLKDALATRYPKVKKPLFIFDQQQTGSERKMIADAVKATFAGLMEINKITRKPADFSALCLGLECGGSDGFSGISANPALGHASDLLVALGGRAILSEFPELNGAEQELINRCVDMPTAKRFTELMQSYSRRAQQVGSGFDNNPSPGNIKDGLITDAMKSAGAAKKGGTSPVTAVLDYTEPAVTPGLNLLCTPGNDVESTTGLAGSGANLIVFTTGLGTPTGNPVSPTVKLSSNTELAQRMPDLIDLDAGTIISGEHSIEEKGEELFQLLIEVANGHKQTRAEKLGQNDFIPWKRGISL